MPHLHLSVPNVASGTDPAIAGALTEAVTNAGAKVIDVHRDRDHDRTVLTVAAPRQHLVGAMLDLAEQTLDLVDIRANRGVHPKLGVLDVAPFVALDEAGMVMATDMARELAEGIGGMGVPCFLYGPPFGRELPAVRRGAFERVAPDSGPSAPHPTAGACCIGARWPLVALNVEVRAEGDSEAKRMASEIRTASGGLPGVRALGFYLPSAGSAQVSMNLTSPSRTTIPMVLAEIAKIARDLGVVTGGVEVVGVVPRAALEGMSWEEIGTSSPIKVLEDELAALGDR